MELRLTLAILLSGCSLLLDGSDLRGDRRDAGQSDGGARDAALADAGCPSACGRGMCCVGGECVDDDVDDDGYPHPACGAPVSDCDDGDGRAFPWPPRNTFELVEQGLTLGTPRQLDAIALSPTCGAVALLSGTGTIVVDAMEGSDEGCIDTSMSAPGSWDCFDTLAFSEHRAIDLRRVGDGAYITVGGRCGSEDRIRSSAFPALDAHDNLLVVALDEVEVLSTDRLIGVIYRTTLDELRFASFAGSANVQRLSTEPMHTEHDVAALRAGTNVDLIQYGDGGARSTATVLGAGAPSGRERLVRLTGGGYVLIQPVGVAGTALSVRGPFADVLGAQESPTTTSPWSAMLVDPLVDAAPVAGNRFAVVGRDSTSLRVALGTAAVDGTSIDTRELAFPLPGDPVDVAIATEMDADGTTSVFLALTLPTTLWSAGFRICAP